MNKIILLLVIIIVLIFGAYFLLRDNKSKINSNNSGVIQSTAEKTVVSMTDENGFSPSTINIKQGEIIVFKNNSARDHWPASAIHPTHQVYPEFDPKKPVSPGDSWSFVFNKKGSWRYHDHLNPTFTGTINVE